MKYVLIILFLAGCFYIYNYLNKKHMDEVKLKRVQEMKNVDQLEFNRSLYKVQAARQRIKEQIGNMDEQQKNMEFKFKIPVSPTAPTQEELKNLKKEEVSIPTTPSSEEQERYIDQNESQIQQDPDMQQNTQEENR